MAILESLLTVPEAARLARVSARMFWKLIASERAPEAVRIGRAVRLRASDIDLWIKLGCPTRAGFEGAKGVSR
jgi:excisionase family DNA binding protein